MAPDAEVTGRTPDSGVTVAKARDTASALAAGTAAGWLVDLATIPLGWLVGSMLMSGALSLAGVSAAIPRLVHMAVLAVIGLYLGGTFTPEMTLWIERAHISVVAMLLTVSIEVVVSVFVMSRLLGANFITACTACIPGGFSTMASIAKEYGGDVEVVSLVHLVRVVFLVLTIAVASRFWDGLTVEHVELAMSGVDQRSLIFVLLAWLVGFGIALMSRRPVICMMMPMAILGYMQLSGITDVVLPGEPLAVAQVILGVSIGSHWSSFRTKRFLMCLSFGMGLAVFLVSFSALSAWVVSNTAFFELEPTMLSFMPGGVGEISLIAISLGIDPAFVGLHHIVRVIFILLTLPIIFHVAFKLQKGRGGPPPPAVDVRQG